MVLICHMILKDHVTKARKSAITIFSKAHGMSYSHIRNFTITGALTKTFARPLVTAVRSWSDCPG